MKKYIFLIIAFGIVISCFTASKSTFLKIDHQKIQTFGFNNPGNLYVIKYKSIKNKNVLKNILNEYKSNRPVLLEHINGVSINIDNVVLKEVIEDFLQAGEIEYIERTPIKTLN
jgi:hypothetical protein